MKDEKYNVFIESVDGDTFGVQDLAEADGPEKDVSVDRFVMKLDPKDIDDDDDELSEGCVEMKKKSFNHLRPHQRGGQLIHRLMDLQLQLQNLLVHRLRLSFQILL